MSFRETLSAMTAKERLTIAIALVVPALAIVRYFLVGTGSDLDVEFLMVFALIGIPVAVIVIYLTYRNAARRIGAGRR